MRAVRESEEIMSDTSGGLEGTAATPITGPQSEGSEEIPATTIGHSRLRELLHLIINESLSVGERPDSVITTDTDLGESIEVRSKDPRGDVKTKVIELTVDTSVPETLLGGSSLHVTFVLRTNKMDSRRARSDKINFLRFPERIEIHGMRQDHRHRQTQPKNPVYRGHGRRHWSWYSTIVFTIPFQAILEGRRFINAPKGWLRSRATCG